MRLRTQNTSFAAAAVGSFQKNEVKNRSPKRKRHKRRITDETDSAHPRKSKQYHFGVPFVSPDAFAGFPQLARGVQVPSDLTPGASQAYLAALGAARAAMEGQ